MSIPEVAAKVAADYELSKGEAEAVVRCVLSVITEGAMSEEGLSLHGFGTFKIKSYAARKGRNPRTGESVAVGASRKLTFRQAKAIKDRLGATGQRKKRAPAAARKPARPRA